MAQSSQAAECILLDGVYASEFKRLRARGAYFTIAQMQEMCEAVLHKACDAFANHAASVL